MSFFESTKTFGHEEGISCAFRQWRAESHCQKIHGYALSFKIVFVARYLDERGWVVDFGSLKELKQTIKAHYDHRLVVAEDDPQLDTFLTLSGRGIADVRYASAVGCEAFAKEVYMMTLLHLRGTQLDQRVNVRSVECAEHGANSAIYYGD